MTREHRAQNIVIELAEAERCLRAAEALFALDLYKDALNRAYYAAYHWCIALLLSSGLEAKSHRGVVSVVGSDFVAKGAVPAATQHDLARLSTYRELSDYDRSFVATRDLVANELDAARRVRDAARAHLVHEGFIGP